MSIYKNLKKYNLRILVVLLLTFGNALGELFLPKLMSLIVDSGVARNDSPYIFKMGFVMIIVVLLTVLCRASASYHSSKVTMAFSRDLRRDLFTKINKFSFEDVEDFSISSLITRTTDDVNQVEQMVLMGLRPMIRGPLMFVGGLIMAISTNLKLSIVFPVSIPFIVFGIGIVIKIGLPYFPILQRRLDKINGLFRRRLTGIRVIRAFRRDVLEEDIFTKANEKYFTIAQKVSIMMMNLRPILTIILNVALVIVMYYGARLIDIGELEVGEMMAFIQYITQVLTALIMMSFLLTMVPRTYVSMNRINEVLEYSETLRGSDKKIRDIENIEARNLSFCYPDAKRKVLSDINFSLKKGETLGIIGGTGSGKSTILKLLLQFYEPNNRGELFINGLDIKDIETKSLRENISYVPQNNFFFSKSIRDNLKFGDRFASDNNLIEATQIAQASEFLKGDFLDKKMARAGSNFSGGQRQRLAIARAITRDASCFLFDDSFSALDYKTDYELRCELKKKLKDKITIIVAQRVATILDADKILVIEDGVAVGFGTHKELMKSNEVYREIATSQGQEV